MKKIFQVYVPSYYRCCGKEALKAIFTDLVDFKEYGAYGIWLIGLWDSDWSDIGFSIRSYTVNPLFGDKADLGAIIDEAHRLGLEVGCDVVPNHMSVESDLVQNATADMLYVVSADDTERLQAAGVPSFFGQTSYSRIKTARLGEIYARTKFADGTQIDLNWESPKIRTYFKNIFKEIREIGFDFARVDCAELLLEKVENASKADPSACMQPTESIKAILEASSGMKIFLESFHPGAIIENTPQNVYVVDCSFCIDGGVHKWDSFRQKTLGFKGYKNYVPLLGGHDQMPFRNRFGISFKKVCRKVFRQWPFEYIFTDLATEKGFLNTQTVPTELDKLYDANLENPNERWMGRAVF